MNPTPTPGENQGPDVRDQNAMILAALADIRELLIRLLATMPAAAPGGVHPDRKPQALPAVPRQPMQQLVTMDQCAAMVKKRKQTLLSYRGKGMPPPTVQGRRGQSNLWDWPVIRPWLETTFGIIMPEQFPTY